MKSKDLPNIFVPMNNKIICLHCHTAIESNMQDDVQFCKCGKVKVYGGLDLFGRTGKEHYDYCDISSYRIITQTDLINKYGLEQAKLYIEEFKKEGIYIPKKNTVYLSCTY